MTLEQLTAKGLGHRLAMLLDQKTAEKFLTSGTAKQLLSGLKE